MATAHGENVVGLVGWITSIVIMALVGLSIVRCSFNLIWELPDRVVRWIGHSGEQLGKHQDEQDVRRRFFAAYDKAVGGMKAPGAQPGENTIGGPAKQKDEQNKDSE